MDILMKIPSKPIPIYNLIISKMTGQACTDCFPECD